MRPGRIRGASLLVRCGVVACVLVAAALCLERFDQTMGLYDWRADRHDALAYLARLYGDDGLVGSRTVVEEARARMPADARYRVAVGPRLRAGNRFTTLEIGEFLRYFLLPRRQVGDDSAGWAFCFGCDPAVFGGRYRPLADAGNGISFGRLAG